MKLSKTWLEETKRMRFQEVYDDWTENRLTQEEAANILGVCDRTFRRYIHRYESEGLEGLSDKRMSQISHLRAPVDEVMALTERYRKSHLGWNAKHFHAWYRRSGGTRSYNWVKLRLQDAKLIEKAEGRGKHRKRRERAALPGMMIHQDGSMHQWIDGIYWDLIITLDDATSEHYSMFFVEQEGTFSSFRGVQETIEKKGLFCSFYSDRGSHYWTTPEAGGKVDKIHLTQFGLAMKQLGIQMIPAYSPEARGRCERMFKTHQERLPKELALAGIQTLEQANDYLKTHYLPQFNQEFSCPAQEEGTAFVPYLGPQLSDILSEQYERVVGKDNCVSFEGLKLQIPKDQTRYHYVKAKVRIQVYQNGQISIFHGPRRLADYDCHGFLIQNKLVSQAA